MSGDNIREHICAVISGVIAAEKSRLYKHYYEDMGAEKVVITKIVQPVVDAIAALKAERLNPTGGFHA